MLYKLHRLVVELAGDAEPLWRDWSLIWSGWPQTENQRHPDVALHLALVASLPPLPEGGPYFSDGRHDGRSEAEGGILSVYQGETAETAVLHYLDGALVTVPLGLPAGPLRAEGVVTRRALQNGRFEDITFTSLAPLLRRHGYYLLHAFAVVKEEKCLLLVGPSGSGKTTTGLSLLAQGWQLLANDVVLLERRPDGVYALPTPGVVSIRPGTLTLLPGLAARLGISRLPLSQDITISSRRLTRGKWGEAARITAVYFPQISPSPRPLTPLPRAIHLAQLMAESIDRWDEAALPDHMHLLESLSRQAPAFQLPIRHGVLPTLS
jgi:hypothetical protein